MFPVCIVHQIWTEIILDASYFHHAFDMNITIFLFISSILIFNSIWITKILQSIFLKLAYQRFHAICFVSWKHNRTHKLLGMYLFLNLFERLSIDTSLFEKALYSLTKNWPSRLVHFGHFLINISQHDSVFLKLKAIYENDTNCQLPFQVIFFVYLYWKLPAPKASFFFISPPLLAGGFHSQDFFLSCYFQPDNSTVHSHNILADVTFFYKFVYLKNNSAQKTFLFFPFQPSFNLTASNDSLANILEKDTPALEVTFLVYLY